MGMNWLARKVKIFTQNYFCKSLKSHLVKEHGFVYTIPLNTLKQLIFT